MNSFRSLRESVGRVTATAVVMAVVFWVANTFGAEATSHAVNFPTGDAAWTVNLEKTKNKNESEPSTPPAREIKKVEIVRIGNTRRDLVHWSLGGTTEYWWITKPSVVLFQAKPGEAVRSMTPDLFTVARYDQTLFSWVGASTFVETKTEKGKKVHYYQREVPVQDGTMRQSAAIDAETGIPIEWADEICVVHFSFDAKLPDSRLEMPAQFQAALKNLEGYFTPPKRVSRW